MAKSPILDEASIAAHLAFEESARDKHELFRGRIHAMAGGSADHGEIIDSLAGLCRDTLREKTCRFLSENRKVVVEKAGSAYFPDGAIACPPSYLDRRNGTYDIRPSSSRCSRPAPNASIAPTRRTTTSFSRRSKTKS